MELIDVDLYKRRLMEFIPNNDVAFDILADMPRIDIVRCKDCVNGNMDRGFFLCCSSGMVANEDDFCSYGERKD